MRENSSNNRGVRTSDQIGEIESRLNQPCSGLGYLLALAGLGSAATYRTLAPGVHANTMTLALRIQGSEEL